MSSTTLEIIQGLAQAAANSYDGAHDARFSYDGEARTAGLRREEGCPIMDPRVMDGFSVKFYGNSMIINYQSEIFYFVRYMLMISNRRLKDVSTK